MFISVKQTQGYKSAKEKPLNNRLYFTFILNLYKCAQNKQNDTCKYSGVSVKFEVDSWLEKNNQLYEPVGGSGGMLPQKILKSGSSEMPFPAF